MSVLIKDMAMPTSCLSCPLQGGTEDCRLTQKTYNWGLTERPSDCPLIEVPDDVQPVKCGRWIERDCNFDVECKCSMCGAKDFIPSKFDRYWFNRKYCPNCGAKMDGEA